MNCPLNAPSTDSLVVTDVDRSQLFSLHGIAAEHRFSDSRCRATRVARNLMRPCNAYLMGGWRVVRIVPGLAPDAFDEGTDFVR